MVLNFLRQLFAPISEEKVWSHQAVQISQGIVGVCRNAIDVVAVLDVLLQSETEVVQGARPAVPVEVASSQQVPVVLTFVVS